MLEDKYDCYSNGTFRNQIFKKYKRKGKFYLDEIAACKIVLNLRGAGWDTMRYWEVPGTGAFMISQKPEITIPNNFIDREHVCWCSHSLDDLTGGIDFYLKEEEKRERMAEKAHQHLLKYHLNTHRAIYLLEKIKQLL
jgi:spore maturation protein CgeB